MATPNQKNSALSALSAVKTCPPPVISSQRESRAHLTTESTGDTEFPGPPTPNQKNSALSALSAVKTCPPPPSRHSRRSGNPEPWITLRWQRGRGGNPAMPSIPNQVERQPGLWIPAAARMTGAGALSVVNPPSGNASVTLGGVASYGAVHCAPMARSIAPLKCPAQMRRKRLYIH